MVLFDVLGRRWTLRILWELRDGAQSFRALRQRCDDISPTVLNDRLKQLRALAFVSQGEAGYALTETGRELSARLVDLDHWAARWASGLTEGQAAPADEPER
ncbi:MAG: helix-turn-helix domain-containing protein [Pseudomonadota bacterium]